VQVGEAPGHRPPAAVPRGPPAHRTVIATAARCGGAIRSVRVYRQIMYGATVTLARATVVGRASSAPPASSISVPIRRVAEKVT